MTNADKKNALELILDSIVDAVSAGGERGAPSGVLYAALMHYGCNIAQFEAVMGLLVARGRLTKRGQLYFAVNREKERA